MSKVYLVRLKRMISRVIASELAGSLVKWRFGSDIPYRGLAIDVQGAALSGRLIASLYWGLYESAEWRFIDRYLLPSCDTVELGSGIGAVSSHIAKRLAPGRRLVCVEANPRLESVLRRNLDKHGAHLRAQVVIAAICNERGEVGLAVSSNHLGSAILGLSHNGDSKTVTAIRLSELLTASSLGEYQLIADVEGAEALIAHYDSDALKTCRQIIIELHGTSIDGNRLTVRDLIRSYQTLGFQVEASYGPVVVFRR